jgi:hypothetical protein
MAYSEQKKAVVFFLLGFALREKPKKNPTNKLLTSTNLQFFLDEAPRSSFNKLVTSMPSLLQCLHTMSLVKSVAEGLKPQECKRTKLREPPPIPTFPRKTRSRKELPN